MGITTLALDGYAAVVGGSQVQPTHIAIGTGNTAFTTADTTLDTETDRNSFTSIDLSVGSTVTFVADFSATEISGTSFIEFGILNSGAAGLMYNREVLTGSTVFDGTTELQVQQSYKFYT